MANQILAGAVVQAGYIIAGVDADNPPYVGPVIPYILFGGNWTDDPQIMNALTGETTAVPIPTSGTGIDGTDGIGRNQIHIADGMVIMVGYTSITVYTDLSEVGTVLDHPPGGLDSAYNFGNDVHVAGDYIYVGTALEDGHLGTIQIYNKNTLQWHSELKPTDPWYNTTGGSHLFGKHFAVTEATSLYPHRLWVGVPSDDQGTYPNSGKVYYFGLDADGLPTGQQGQEISDGFRNAEYGAFLTQDGEYVAFGYGPASAGHVNSSPHAPYNGKIFLTNTEYGPGYLELTSGMTDYWTDPSLASNYPYPPNNNFGAQNNELVVTDDYVIVGNGNHQSSSHNNSNANGVAYGALYFYDRYGVEDNWTTTTPVYTFIAENDSPTIDGVGQWLIECDGKLYVGTRDNNIALVFNLSDIQAAPAQISRPAAIADSVWTLNSNNSGPVLLPSSMVPPPPPPIFNVSADDWYMFGSATVAASGNGFTFERGNFGNGNVAEVTITGLTVGQEYQLSVTGSGANTSWNSEVAILGVVQVGRAFFDPALASNPVTKTDTWTQSSDNGDTIKIRVRIGYGENWTGNPAGIWTFTDIAINEL